jgi:phage gp37-like protein
MAAVLS